MSDEGKEKIIDPKASVTAPEAFVEADQKLVLAAKSIKILSTLGWADHHCDDFLKNWKSGNPKLPEISYPKFDFKNERQLLKNIVDSTTEDHPVGWYIVKTAQSYSIAAQMLEGLGTPAFSECSEFRFA